MTYRDPPRVPVKDQETQQAIDEVRRALMELSRDVRSRDVTITLVDGVPLKVVTGLGRPILNYSFSAPIGGVTVGMISEISRTSDVITLQADGYGATVSVSVNFR